MRELRPEVEGALPERTLPERPAMPLMPAPQGQETFSPPPSFSPPASGYESAPASACSACFQGGSEECGVVQSCTVFVGGSNGACGRVEGAGSAVELELTHRHIRCLFRCPQNMTTISIAEHVRCPQDMTRMMAESLLQHLKRSGTF